MNSYKYVVIGEYIVVINVLNCVFNVFIEEIVIVELLLNGVICNVICVNRDIEVNEIVIVEIIV